ncbi:hypothetical protein GQ457_16G025050 [Hibiscus cannabinus]
MSCIITPQGLPLSFTLILRKSSRILNPTKSKNPILGEQVPISDLKETEAVLHGFQHYLVMLGTTLIISSTIVPLMLLWNGWPVRITPINGGDR